MLEKFFTKRFAIERFRASPVGSHIDGFATALFARGYSAQVGSPCLHHAVHLGLWMESSGIPLDSLDEMVLTSFEEHFSTCQCVGERPSRHTSVHSRVRVFHRYLQDADVVARPVAVVVVDEPLVTNSIAWMRQQRGASERTIKSYLRVVRRLLELVGNDPSKYTMPALRKAVVAIAEGRGLATRVSIATATRLFLRQLAVRGLCSIDLADGVPCPARWKQTTLPKHLSGADVEKLLGACDLGTPTGLRDRAVMLLLARLGLRAGDVAALQLADVDWMAATIRVVGKGRRETRLPLPQDEGLSGCPLCDPAPRIRHEEGRRRGRRQQPISVADVLTQRLACRRM
jgi:integrase/recombinase XerD